MVNDELNIEQLQAKVVQQEKIIAALMQRAEVVNAGLASDFNAFTHSVNLEKQVAVKTKQYRELAEQLQKQSFKLKAERSFYLGWLNIIGYFVIIIGLDHKIIFSNAAILAVSGLSLEEVQGGYLWEQEWFDFPDADIGAIKDGVLNALAGESSGQELQIKVEDKG